MLASKDIFAGLVGRVRGGEDAGALAAELAGLLTPEEKLGLLDGDTPFWEGMRVMVLEGYVTTPVPMGEVARLGIPGVQFVDGPRGICVGHSTAFPVSMARGATWDAALEARVGTAIGLEGRAQGGTLFAGVCINLPRHPAWGRAQETYGEDPLLLGTMGAALVDGVQHNLMACAKHYATNSMENARFSVDVIIDDEALHHYFLPHFRQVVEAGACSIMSAYNSVNGEWAGQSEEMLTGILRDRWGFTGFTMTDFIWGMRDPVASLRAGQDIEAPFAQQRAVALAEALDSGAASWDDVERSCRRILSTQLRFFAGIDDVVPPLDVVAGPDHAALAREVAATSMVLLKNEQTQGAATLPLAAAELSSLAVLGRLADMPNTGDHGSSDVRAPYVVTALDGLRAALPGARIVHDDGSDPDAAARAAADADAAVVVVGYTAMDEGEWVGGDILGRDDLWALYPDPADAADQSVADALREVARSGGSVVGGESAGGDRASLRLRADDVALIRAVAARQPRTVVAIVAAGAVLIEEWKDEVPAILVAWYSGMEGGNALADVLLGRVDAAGRLPFSVPTSEEHLPWFDRDATAITYDKWFGQRLLDRLGEPAAFPLGFGLSYTSFVVEPLATLRSAADPAHAEVRVRVHNTGQRPGRHVVQLYAHDAEGARHLVGFAPVTVAAGGSEEIAIGAELSRIGTWDAAACTAIVPRSAVEIEISAYSGDPAAIRVTAPGA